MSRSELIRQMAKRFPQLHQQNVGEAVAELLKVITKALQEKGQVRIGGFGVFNLRYRQSRHGRNPRTGAAIMIPAKYAPYFRPALELRQLVNGSC